MANKIRTRMAWRQWVLACQSEVKQVLQELIDHEQLESGCLMSAIKAKEREFKSSKGKQD
jgi:hypothetical protein